MWLERLDPEGDMWSSPNGLRHGRSLGVAQEFNVFGMIARIGHPAPALFNPIFIRLRLGCCEADVVKNEHGPSQPFCSFAENEEARASSSLV